MIIDSHTHVFPDPLREYYEEGRNTVKTFLPLPNWSELRQLGRTLLTGYSESLQKSQPMMRYLPEALRSTLDVVGSLGSIPSLFVESSVTDLKQKMEKHHIAKSIVIPHPPFATNEFVLSVCKDDPSLIPVAYIVPETLKPSQTLRRLVDEENVKALKLHPASDGDLPSSPRYRALIKTAGDLGIPIILHTGCVHVGPLYKNPDLGRVEHFVPWFKNFPEQKFLLAHMNFHEPERALELCQEFPNLFVDTSWQPAEIIGEAVKKIGSDRILFASNWPLMGRSIDVSIRRIDDAVTSGFISKSDSELILGLNAVKFLNIK
ncbi:MAG: amidohydrolase family protein [Xanthomonadaceae bacterium]|nr:amidohydrolase family protein [Xanthomonadaceae bacterium]